MKCSSIYGLTGQLTISGPAVIQGCAGSNITIPWVFGQEDDVVYVTWYVESENYAGDILIQDGNRKADVINNFNVKHVSNGQIVIFNSTINNTGEYTISVVWRLFASETHTVSVLVMGKMCCLMKNSEPYLVFILKLPFVLYKQRK